MAPPRTTRTQARLHFDDLDPRRFEDMVRQLAFDFRPWRSLEAVGESGSDDGLDARGYEIVVVDPSTGLPLADASPQQDRLWVIQCKREKSLGPQDVKDIVEKAVDGAGGSVHGLILAASVKLSKRARDKLASTAKTRGVQEVYFWGQAELEDMLFQARYQHLLFAYFGISLHGSARRGAILANLRWEMNSNIASLCRRSGKVPMADVMAIRSIRRRIQLTSTWLSENSGNPIQLSVTDARRLLMFWSAIIGTARDIKTDAIRQAIASGEFLEIELTSSPRISGPVDLDLRRLVDTIERYVILIERVSNSDNIFTEAIEQIHSGYSTIGLRPDMLVFLFAAYDRLVDILRLSGTLLRYLLNPSTSYTPPTLRPISPLEDAVEGLEAEAASHADVEGWIQDPVLWGMLVDEPVSDPELKRRSRERYPEFWNKAYEGLDKRIRDIVTRHGTELNRQEDLYGKEAADMWLQKLLERET